MAGSDTAFVMTKVISLPGRMHLREVNRKLAEEVADHKWTEEVRSPCQP
jgi:hypothetical protein